MALTPLFALVFVGETEAQVDGPLAQEKPTLELVDQIKDLIERAERDQRSKPWLIRQLRGLVRQYDWPWRVALLHDDFRDGDFISNPSWLVASGDFWVGRGSGLRTDFDPPSDNGHRETEARPASPAIEILEGIVWGGREREGGNEQAVSPSAAEIYTELPISNSFAVKLRLDSRSYPERYKRLEMGPYQGGKRDWGYRLAYESGTRASLTLLRTAPGRSAVIDIYEGRVDLEDGRVHLVEWRRDENGEMVVLLDEKEVIRSVDRAYSDSFDGFTLINKGGDYELKDISIFGARR